jgi:peptidoglycan/xylan/chitin deacetylase (PgdA/CDA1 family)
MLRRAFNRIARRARDPRSRSRVVILAYHGLVREPLRVPDWCFLDVEVFRRHEDFLRDRCEVLLLGEAARRLENGTLDGPAAVITFDDGFRSVYDLAFPVLDELGTPATVFLVTGLLDTHQTLWFTRLHQALSTTDRSYVDWDGMRFDLGDPERAARSSAAMQQRLKRFPADQLELEVDAIVGDLGGVARPPVAETSPFSVLDRSGVAAMAQSSLVELGAHTVSHAILRPLTSDRKRFEIGRSLAAVKELTGRPCEVFAYPNGRAEDYDGEAVALLREYGVRAAVTTIEGFNDASTPPLELKRVGIGSTTTRAELEELFE